LVIDAEYDRDLVRQWVGYGAELAPDPQRAIDLRDEVTAYIARVPRDRAAVLCSASLRPVLADLLLRSGVRVDVLSYGELPPELALAPAGRVEGRAALL
jgi:flagellar biosynthesis component FlhA